jgi:hypothetical protein
MSNPLNRGTTPARARDASQRPATFQNGHRKFGGRKKGTPNVVTKDLKIATIEAATRIGSDGNGKDGLVGYLMWLAAVDTRTFGGLLRALLPLQPPAEPNVTIKFRSADELREKLIAQGVPAAMLPVPALKFVDADAVRAEAEEDQAEYMRNLGRPAKTK